MPTAPPAPSLQPAISDLELGHADAEAALARSSQGRGGRRSAGGGTTTTQPPRAPSSAAALEWDNLTPKNGGGGAPGPAGPSPAPAAAAAGAGAGAGGGGGTTTTPSSPAPSRRGARFRTRLACPTIIPPRPNTWDFKTREREWAARHSKFRYLHGTFFFLGPPDHLLAEIWPPFLFNMVVACVVASDFVGSATARSGTHWHSGFLPDRLPVPLGNMESLTRMMLLAVSLLATWRVNRVYERWWSARQSFAALGSVAVGLSQRAHAWIQDPAIVSAIDRWSVVFHYSILQMCRFDAHLHPDGAALLTPEELALYDSTRKPRQLALLALTRAVAGADLPPAQAMAMDELLAKASSAAGVVGALRFSPMPDGLCSLSTGFAETFLLLLPLSWWAAAPAERPEPVMFSPAAMSALLSLTLYIALNLLFLGALAAADKLEAPFDRLPLLDIVDTTRRDVARRAALLATWRDFVELLRRLPPDVAAARKAEAASQIRAAAASTTTPDAAASADGLKRLVAAVSTLRATTARVPGERRGGRGGVYVLREGKLVQDDGRSSTSRSIGAGRLSAGEAMDRHRALLKRQHFGRDPPPGRQLF